MIKKEDINELEKRLERIKESWKYFDKYFHILSGKVVYTNDDINELLAYYTKKEKYEACERLIKLRK
jgi:peptidyl-tRNA hydrolase